MTAHTNLALLLTLGTLASGLCEIAPSMVQNLPDLSEAQASHRKCPMAHPERPSPLEKQKDPSGVDKKTHVSACILRWRLGGETNESGRQEGFLIPPMAQRLSRPSLTAPSQQSCSFKAFEQRVAPGPSSSNRPREPPTLPQHLLMSESSSCRQGLRDQLLMSAWNRWCLFYSCTVAWERHFNFHPPSAAVFKYLLKGRKTHCQFCL